MLYSSKKTMYRATVMSPRNVLIAIYSSSFINMAILLASVLSGSGIISYWTCWLMVFCNFLLQSIILIPIIGFFRQKILWFDPILWLYVLLILMTNFLPISCAIDMEYVRAFVRFGSYIFLGRSDEYILFQISQAQFVFLIFSWTVLYKNRYIFGGLKHIKIHKNEALSAWLTGVIFGLAGLYGFMSVWSSASFSNALFDMGSVQDITDQSGLGRYFILQNIAVVAIPMGIIGWFCLRKSYSSRNKNYVGWFEWILIVLSLIPGLVFGSRITLLFTIVTSCAQLYTSGLIIKQKMLAVSGILSITMILLLTILRANILTSSSALNSSSFLQASADYLSTKGSPVGPLVDLDRTGAVALVIEYTQSHNTYVRGETLFAGPMNLLDAILSKLSNEGWIQEGSWDQANTVIANWRFGQAIQGWAVPPSYPGEYFMQFGYISVIIGSVIFAYLIGLLRRYMWSSTSLISRWLSVIIISAFVKFSSTEISVIFSQILFVVLPVVLLYYIIYFFFSLGSDFSIREV